MSATTTSDRPIDVGDVVTRGRSRLRWVVDSVHTDGPSGKQWATLRPIGASRYTAASAPLDHLTRIEVDDEPQ